MIFRYHLFKAERIEQLSLVLLQPTHHGLFPPLTASTSGNHCSRKPSTDFCNKIGTFRTWLARLAMSGFGGILLQKSKVATIRIVGENLKRGGIADSYSRSRAAVFAYEFSVRRRGPPQTLRENDAYSPQNF